MNAEFTLTPWAAVVNSSEVTTIYDANQMPVCRLNLNDWGVDEDNEAEFQTVQTKVAALIAAAPDLLEACRLFLTYHDGVDKCDVAMMLAYADAEKAIRAAVVKATGGAA